MAVLRRFPVGPGGKIGAACVAFLLLAGCGNKSETAARNAGSPPKPEVSVVTLHPQSVAITTELPGRTTASLTAEVRPQVNGLIKSRDFKEGGEVRAGDLLYQIDPETYQAAYDSALAAQQKAEAAVPNAQAKVERYQTLIKQNAVSKQDLDDAVAALAQARADVGTAKANVDTARINLGFTRVTAPIGGRIDKSSLTPGALVTASQTTLLTTIRTIDPIFVDVTESSTNLLNWRQAVAAGRIKFSGTDVTVRLKLENGTTYPLAGKMEVVEYNISETTGTFALRATFSNPDRLLLPGAYVRATVEQGIAENSFVVPQRAVTRNTKGEATGMFVNADGKVEQRVLAVSQNVGNNWLVTSGVKDGDQIIVEGTQLVQPGAAVTAVEVTIDNTSGEVKARKQGALQSPSATRFAEAVPVTAKD
ncbi:efflux RND transporter periplasmic adaptor subunit [soil metagenome]